MMNNRLPLGPQHSGGVRASLRRANIAEARSLARDIRCGNEAATARALKMNNQSLNAVMLGKVRPGLNLIQTLAKWYKVRVEVVMWYLDRKREHRGRKGGYVRDYKRLVKVLTKKRGPRKTTEVLPESAKVAHTSIPPS
jgi:hypothetical protein